MARTVEAVDADLRKVRLAREVLRSALKTPPPGGRGDITARIDSLDTSLERLLDERLAIRCP